MEKKLYLKIYGKIVIYIKQLLIIIAQIYGAQKLYVKK